MDWVSFILGVIASIVVFVVFSMFFDGDNPPKKQDMIRLQEQFSFLMGHFRVLQSEFRSLELAQTNRYSVIDRKIEKLERKQKNVLRDLFPDC